MKSFEEIMNEVYAKAQADIVNDLVNGKQWYWCSTDKGTAYISPTGHYAYVIPKEKLFIKAVAFKDVHISEKLNLDYFDAREIGKYKNPFGGYTQFVSKEGNIYTCFYDKVLRHFPKEAQLCVSGSMSCAMVCVEGICIGYAMPIMVPITSEV